MLTFDTLDAGVQRKLTRFAIECFLQELGEQFGSPDQWQLAVANDAIAAYQRGEFDCALRCISIGERPPDRRPCSAPVTMQEGNLSLRSLWSCLAEGRSSFTPPGTGTHVHTKQSDSAPAHAIASTL